MPDTPVDDLKECIAKGKALVIVGTGVSIAATDNAPCASWKGLLRHGADRCVKHCAAPRIGWADIVRQEIDSDDVDNLLSAAEKITSKLKAPTGGEYRRWLKDSVGELTATKPDVIKALDGLNIPLATTNYDGLIEEVTGLPRGRWRRLRKLPQGNPRELISALKRAGHQRGRVP